MHGNVDRPNPDAVSIQVGEAFEVIPLESDKTQYEKEHSKISRKLLKQKTSRT